MGRTLKTVLDRRRRKHADVGQAEYIQPVGGGLHLVRYPGCTQTRTVSTTRGSTTFRPGSAVLVGSFSGDRQQSILGVPPPGLKGTAAFSLLDLTLSDSQPNIIRTSPITVTVGFPNQLVYLIGMNLLEDPLDTFGAVVIDGQSWIADPDVTIHTPIWIADPSTIPLTVTPLQKVVSVLVDVAVTAAVGHFPIIRVERS